MRNKLSIIPFLSVMIVGLALAGPVWAAAAACPGLDFLCNGPGGPVTHGVCGATVCTACATDSPAYKAACVGPAGQSQSGGVVSSPAWWARILAAFVKIIIDPLRSWWAGKPS